MVALSALPPNDGAGDADAGGFTKGSEDSEALDQEHGAESGSSAAGAVEEGAEEDGEEAGEEAAKTAKRGRGSSLFSAIKYAGGSLAYAGGSIAGAATVRLSWLAPGCTHHSTRQLVT